MIGERSTTAAYKKPCLYHVVSSSASQHSYFSIPILHLSLLSSESYSSFFFHPAERLHVTVNHVRQHLCNPVHRRVSRSSWRCLTNQANYYQCRGSRSQLGQSRVGFHLTSSYAKLIHCAVSLLFSFMPRVTFWAWTPASMSKSDLNPTMRLSFKLRRIWL